MHEAGIATLIVANLREQEPPGWQARVLVRGGHTEPGAFDAALRFHLLIADPHLDLSQLEIVHLPRALTCANCGHRYDAEHLTEACPVCGGGAWPDYAPEEVELELLEKAASGKSGCV